MVFGILWKQIVKYFVILILLILVNLKISNDNNRINDVPPAIHFRISMEYWMFVANPNKFENEYVNITY